MTDTAARLAGVAAVDAQLDATPGAFGQVPTLDRLVPTSQSPGTPAGLACDATPQGTVAFANHPASTPRMPPDPLPVASQPGNPVPSRLGEGASVPLASGRFTRAGA
jgi:hypothetical protein